VSLAGGVGLPVNATPRSSFLAALLAVAATYFHFLIFGEFAFLAITTARLPNPGAMHYVLAALGTGGIAGAALGAVIARRSGLTGLRWALRACSAAAIAALLATGLAALTAGALLVGATLGVLTVVLASILKDAAGARLGLCIGAGTGVAYALSNLPPIFHADPATQAMLAALATAVASLLPRWMSSPRIETTALKPRERGTVLRWLVVLTALVWMDSAAFTIVQHTPALRDANWSSPSSLITNAVVHLVFAIVAGVLLDRGRRGLVAVVSIVALVTGCLILNGTVTLAAPAGWFYTAGVSFYSVVLVEFPARLARAWVAALVFAVAGWVGSALGIGMAQNLAGVPLSFVLPASLVVAVALLWQWRIERMALAAAVAVACGGANMRGADESVQVHSGREVYIAEGCMHCHTQYVRPRAEKDVEQWGPARPLLETLAAAPPLIGTRRQGPDLANVGNRRSPEWNRLHLIDPRVVSPGSRMPSYAHLFAGGDIRGESLVAYLASLGASTWPERSSQIAAWKPDRTAPVSEREAQRLFGRLCAGCHGVTGHGDGILASRLSVPPPDWSRLAFRRVPQDTDVEVALSRIIKFGLPGLPMAGHEYLPDGEVVALARFVRTLCPVQGSPPAGQP
jgi:cbb3-type cytochrome c oxidase subunit II